MRKTLPLLLLTIAAFLSCNKEVSKNIDQSKIWTNYELFYDQNTDRTTVSATFQFSSVFGTKLQLSEPSEVKFDNGVLPWNPEGGNYQKEVDGLLANGTFEWTDTEGNVYTNTIEVRDVDFATVPDTLFKLDTVTYYFAWAGDPLLQYERIRLTIDGSGATDMTVFSIDTVGATMIGLDSVKLGRITSGEIQLILEKEYQPDLQEETERGGRLVGKYRATDRFIILADSLQ